QGDCHYQGYIEGFPSSAVTLSTCSGLRGFLQFENVSYGIEPLGHSAFEYFVYQMSNEKPAGSFLATSPPESEPGINSIGDLFLFQPLSAETQSPKYFKVYVVMDTALCKYMGSDTSAAMQKISQVFSLVNNMFNPLNVTIVFSSLELWKEKDEIAMAEEADILLQRFLQWKQPHLAQRSYDVAYLLVYRDRAAFVGAVALGKACQRDAAAAVAVYQRSVTLESFSVLLAQLLARSLGISYDDPQKCHCPRSVCIMSPEALGVGGVRAFSSCSVGDFETFLRHGRGACLFQQPPVAGHSLAQRQVPVCGNGVVEPGEQCDCGMDKECLKNKCCSKTCQLKPGAKCSSGLCCRRCQFKQKNSQCRPPADPQCDLPEFCNGSSASCPPDFYTQDGHSCQHDTGYCYQGRCQSSDLQCQALYGRGSKNAPIACYEEVNSQQDRFGHCGIRQNKRYKSCIRRDLRCGKLICTYPHSTPLASTVAAILYVQVRKHLCISMDY
ncbi:ADA32 protein, partial [Thinocorus orbignyianus]|nr:ADA32 protein [Thinocorus orbignyianus]